MVRAHALVLPGSRLTWSRAAVRIAAKELTSLLLDEERLRHERKDRKSWKSRVQGIEDYPQGSNGYPGRAVDPGTRRPRRHSNPDPRRTEDEDWEYKLAIEASKNQAEEDKKRQSHQADTDDDLAKAIKLSKEEEERRQKDLGQSNADSLFDDTPVQPVQQQPHQSVFQPQDYQQGPVVDLWGNPVNQQNTGYLNGIYGQPTGQFPGTQYPQPTGYDMSQQLNQQGYMAPLPAQPTG